MSTDPAFPSDDATKPEVIISAALYLMSTYGCSGGCPKLAHVILKHLTILAARPDLAAVVRSTCAQLAEQWEHKLATMLPPKGDAKRPATLFTFPRRLVH